jgi:hypothetical protein
MKLKTAVAAGLTALVLAATGATTAQAESRYNLTTPELRTEAWLAYSGEINDGCWADFTGTYEGLVSAAVIEPADDDSKIALLSETHPGYYHVWGPYAGACNPWQV